MPMSGIKVCTKCGEEKATQDFPRDNRRRDGTQAQCKPCHSAASADWNRRNPGRIKAAKAKYYGANAAKARRATREWQKANPSKVNANLAKRLAIKLQRTPPWLTQAHLAEIEGVYHFAKVMEQITGRKYHVDHIEPLQGADVSGLHVPWNLSAIPARDNVAKGNRRIEAHG
jgi:hypothetical protein